MEIQIQDKSGNFRSLESYINDMHDTIMTLQATIVQLEYDLRTQKQNNAQETEELPKSGYDKLKEEIIEEVNLIISDLL